MMKSGYLLLAVATVGAVVLACDAQAQMRTRKGEYYEGIQRKPYGHTFWIWPPAEQRGPVYEPRRGKDADSRRTQKGRNPPTR